MNFPISGLDIYNIIPQRQPIVMISELVDCSSSSCSTSFIIEQSNIFIENGRLSAYGLIENMAQSAAAMNGYLNISENTNPKLGFIGEIKDFVVHRLPAVNQTISTRISLITSINNISLVSAIVTDMFDTSVLYAEAKIKISIQDA